MKFKHLLSLFVVIILITGCSKEAGKTDAKVKLQLAGIVNFSSGIGSGGAILFGKSSNGEQFGKLITSTTLELELKNGDWAFYAVMWDNTLPYKMGSTTYCGKSSQKLNGTAASISLNLNNNNCSDVDFADGEIYSDASGKKHFSDFVLDECDELNNTGNFTCHLENQGSALSYRMVFKSFNKNADGSVIYADDSIKGICMLANGIPSMLAYPMNLNFPSSSTAMPFMISVEMFIGSSNCGEVTPEVKGVYVHHFDKGIGALSSNKNKLVKSPALTCNTLLADKDKCEDYLGYWTGSTCSLSGPNVQGFIPASECSGAGIPVNGKLIKQMVSIPKAVICKNSNYNLEGIDAFAAGDGQPARPFKICNEWQMNQIGETTISAQDRTTLSYKLMNDLDMNVTDFNVALRPKCYNQGFFRKHHNLNPISQMLTGTCNNKKGYMADTFTGVFNGNNKTISNGRILTGVQYIGFANLLGLNAVVKNLNFKNLEVEGQTGVGAIAGYIANDMNAVIKNITIDGANIEGQDEGSGGLVAEIGSNSFITNAQLRNVTVSGAGYVGGLAGLSGATIQKSMFRGEVKQNRSTGNSTSGGLVAGMSGGSIRESFSEGVMTARGQIIGGIVGEIYSGSILDAYSTMSINNYYDQIGARVGGIVGKNANSSTVTRVYFDGVLANKGLGTTPVVDGISAEGVATACFNSTAASVSTSGCSNSDLRSGADYFSTAGAAYWKDDVAIARPRLKWEFDLNQRICLENSNSSLTLSQQDSLGRGSLLKPYIICTAAQLGNLLYSNMSFVIAEDINVSEWDESKLIPAFHGNLNGQNYSIYGLKFMSPSTSSGAKGLIGTNNGTIQNLKIINNTFSHNHIDSTGMLVGMNNGTIKKVSFIGNTLQGYKNVGMVAGLNNGVIDSIKIDRGVIKGNENVGAAVGLNNGASALITRVSADSDIEELTSAYQVFGGVVGLNSSGAKIDQAQFSGGLEFNTPSTIPNIYVGGIAGLNSGSIKNAMVKNEGALKVYNSEFVGGLVGSNDGVIEKSLALGSLLFHGGIIPVGSKLGALYGDNTGSVNQAYYLNQKTGSYRTTLNADSCSSGWAYFNNAASPFLQVGTTVNLIAPVNPPASSGNLTIFNYFVFSMANKANYYMPCSANDLFIFADSFEENTIGKKQVAELGDINTYTDFVMAYDSNGNGNDKLLPQLLEYHKARMENRLPLLIPPVWELDGYDGTPRLLQIDD